MSTERRPAVLLVEDDEMMRKYLYGSIKNGGYDVYTASDGVDGIVNFNQAGDHIHVVVSDIVMPNMDGLEFCRHITASSRHIFQFMFISGWSAKGLEAYNTNPKALFLSKPFHLRDFMNELDRCMVNVIHKRKRLIENATSGLNSKVDKILERIEGKIDRDEAGLVRSENRTIVLGSGNNISISNDYRYIEILKAVTPGDFSTIRSAMSEIGISSKYIADLERAIELDAASQSSAQMGENSERWLKRALRSVGKGTTKVAGDVATAMLTKVIATYFGYPA